VQREGNKSKLARSDHAGRSAQRIAMCDFSNFELLMGAAIAGVAAALAFIGIAIAQNNSFCTAPLSVGWMIAAGVAAGGAAGALYAAADQLDTYFGCMVSRFPEVSMECVNKLQNVRASLLGMATVVGLMSTACFGATAVAWVPWVGQVAMWAILGTLIVQAVLGASLSAMFFELRGCIDGVVTKSTASRTDPLVGQAITIGAALAVTYGYAYLHYRGMKRARRR